MTNALRNAMHRMNQSIDEWLGEAKEHQDREAWVEYKKLTIQLRFRQVDKTDGKLLTRDVSFSRAEIEASTDAAGMVFSVLEIATKNFEAERK